MSRGTTKVSKTKSPIKYWLSWKGDSGKLQYWDKDKNENVVLDSIDLLVVDRKSTVTGWNEETTSRIYANTISTVKEELTVKAKNKTIAKGTWENIKRDVNEAGGNFTVNLYALAEIDGEMEPVCVQLDKTSLRAWTDFLSGTPLWQVYQGMVHMESGEAQKKGKVTFFVAQFSVKEATEEMNDLAKKFDIEYLQPYFNGEETEDEKAPF